MNTNLTLTDANLDPIKNALLVVPAVKVAIVNLYTLGGIDKASIGIMVAFDRKEDCASGILMNGRHRKFMLHHDGELCELTGWRCSRFRKSHVKSLDDAITKLVKWAGKALEEVA
jgi:hypothetical protein